MKKANTVYRSSFILIGVMYALASVIPGYCISNTKTNDVLLCRKSCKISEFTKRKTGKERQRMKQVNELEASLTNKEYFVSKGKKISRKKAYTMSIGKVVLEVERDEIPIKYSKAYWTALGLPVKKRNQYLKEEQEGKKEGQEGAEERKESRSKRKSKAGETYTESTTKTKGSQEVVKIALNNLDEKKKYIFSMDFVQYLRNRETREIYKGSTGRYGPVSLTNTTSRNLCFYACPTQEITKKTKMQMKSKESSFGASTSRQTTLKREKIGSEPYDWDITIRLNGAVVYEYKRGKRAEYNFVRY